jgi:hypothetical protein
MVLLFRRSSSNDPTSDGRPRRTVIAPDHGSAGALGIQVTEPTKEEILSATLALHHFLLEMAFSVI